MNREKLKLEVSQIIKQLTLLKDKEFETAKHIALVNRLNKLDTILPPEAVADVQDTEELRQLRAKRCAWNYRKERMRRKYNE